MNQSRRERTRSKVSEVRPKGRKRLGKTRERSLEKKKALMKTVHKKREVEKKREGGRSSRLVREAFDEDEANAVNLFFQ